MGGGGSKQGHDPPPQDAGDATSAHSGGSKSPSGSPNSRAGKHRATDGNDYDPDYDPTEPMFDKILVQLEHGCVPKMDVGGKADTYVKIELADATPYPDELFGCKLLEDKSDVRPLLEHTFSVRPKTLHPVWYEEAVLLAYRPKGTDALRGSLKINAWDKDAVGKDEPLVVDHTVAFGELLDRGAEGSWQRVEVPVNAVKDAVPGTHFLRLSVYLERAETRVVSRRDYYTAGLEEGVVDVTKGDVSGGGKAVLLWKTRPGNKKAIFWLPGLNASFHHIHILDVLLEAGWDFYTLDCRRMGRAKRLAKRFDPGWNPLDAHTTGDLKEYCEEIDALFAHAAAVKPAGYARRVLYGNSTGSLVAVTYMHHGAYANDIDGLALNGPFFNWHLAAYAEVLMASSFLTDVYAKLAVPGGGRYVAEGKGISPYSLITWAQYYYEVDAGYEIPGLRSIPSLHTTAEWCKAVTAAQEALKKAPPLHIPIFVISSASDTWVSSEEVLATSDFLGPLRTEVQVNRAAHDVFMSTTTEKVAECVEYMLTWLRRCV